jgi:hypothetical protein
MESDWWLQQQDFTSNDIGSLHCRKKENFFVTSFCGWLPLWCSPLSLSLYSVEGNRRVLLSVWGFCRCVRVPCRPLSTRIITDCGFCLRALIFSTCLQSSECGWCADDHENGWHFCAAVTVTQFGALCWIDVLLAKKNRQRVRGWPRIWEENVLINPSSCVLVPLWFKPSCWWASQFARLVDSLKPKLRWLWAGECPTSSCRFQTPIHWMLDHCLPKGRPEFDVGERCAL